MCFGAHERLGQCDMHVAHSLQYATCQPPQATEIRCFVKGILNILNTYVQRLDGTRYGNPRLASTSPDETLTIGCSFLQAELTLRIGQHVLELSLHRIFGLVFAVLPAKFIRMLS